MTEIEKQVTGTTRSLISVTGVVQGVGFRPFVYQLALRNGLSGRVVNSSAGVEIDIEGSAESVDALLTSLTEEAPPLARITAIRTAAAMPIGYREFIIGDSLEEDGAYQLVSPDSCTCDSCLDELFDPADHRFRYPFINCTNCGPRFTIIEGLPYDRPRTTMRIYNMCPECRAEYEDPGDRRFHAEPNACPICGPTLWLADEAGKTLPADDPVAAAAAALREGKILALKGLGGFQLACLATDEEAVRRLRLRKRRPHKPFAVMMETADDAALHCHVSPAERRLLAAAERPIVLLEQLRDSDISPAVAPRLRHLGVMLPCSPLHFLLMRDLQVPLVMTSGNLAEEPICRTNSEAQNRLYGIADLFLYHDRQIVSTYDDSVAMIVDGEPALIRRARGYAPLPVKLPVRSEPVLAVGGELKNTFCLTHGDDAFVSQHIGDLKDVETLLHFERTEALYERLFCARPGHLACDSHPDYLSTIYSIERDINPVRVQHHQAHIASCLAENGFLDRALGVALDGTGLGDDGGIWGGEFFVGSLEQGFRRAAHFENMPLLGGEAAIREPWRMALAATWEYSPNDIDFVAERFEIPGKKLALLIRQLEAGLNCPKTSSCGRLFDAVAALTLKRHDISYEAQAAVEFEALAFDTGEEETFGPEEMPDRRMPEIAAGVELAETAAGLAIGDLSSRLGSVSYRFSIDRSFTPWIISPAQVIKRVIRNLSQGESLDKISRRFHLGLAEAIVRTCIGLTELHELSAVALSGGVFQNRLLLELVRAGLVREGLEALIHRQLPSNDGGISYGQAAIASYKYRD